MHDLPTGATTAPTPTPTSVLPPGTLVRAATPADVPAIVGLVRELAVYERAGDQVDLTPELLHDAMFGERPGVFGHVAEVDGEVAGIAVWFRNYSTWTGRYGIYLEDLFVQPAHRGKGLGAALLATLAAVCVEHGYSRYEWSVLDWNTPSIEFYKAKGAVGMDEWTVHRVEGEALRRLAAEAPPLTVPSVATPVALPPAGE